MVLVMDNDINNVELYLWDDTNKVWVKAQCDTDGYLMIVEE